MTISKSAFEEACARLLLLNPTAIGVAFKWLDCGCSLICGVTAQGEPVGQLEHVSGQISKWGRKMPICLQCRRDDGLNRTIYQGIHWPGDDSEKPERVLRLQIGRNVFGPGYTEE